MTKIKNITMGITLFAALFASAIGMTAFAASSGVLTLADYNPTCYAALKNTSNATRFCSVTMYETAYNDFTNLSTIGYSSGKKANNGIVSVSKNPSKRHIKATGFVYKGESASSGVSVTYCKTLHLN